MRNRTIPRNLEFTQEVVGVGIRTLWKKLKCLRANILFNWRDWRIGVYGKKHYDDWRIHLPMIIIRVYVEPKLYFYERMTPVVIRPEPMVMIR